MNNAIPDSPTARAAADFAAEAAAEYLLNHSYRTYLFGAAVTNGDVDHEAAFVASMIHDLGLTATHHSDTPFDRTGAEVAARFLESRSWEIARIGLAEAAIIRHTNLMPDEEPTCRLVQAGAAIDVAGLGHEAIPDEQLRSVLRTYPRGTFAIDMRAAFLDEVARHPGGSFAELEGTVQLSDRFGTNPLDTP